MASTTWTFLLSICAILLYPVRILGQDFDVNEENFFRFRSRPDIIAPRWNITTLSAEQLSPGYWFLAPYVDLGPHRRDGAWIGPHIYDSSGELVWSGVPLFDQHLVSVFRASKYRGEDVLTGLYFHDNAAVILNNRYEIIRKIIHTNDLHEINIHEFNVVEDGARAIVGTQFVGKNLSEVVSRAVGFDGQCAIRENGFRYLDLTGDEFDVLLDWNATDHIGLDESMVHASDRVAKDEGATYPEDIQQLCTYSPIHAETWEPHHFDSWDLLPDGDFLLTARNTGAVYKISANDGSVVWRLGGTKSSFRFLRPVAEFHWPHHARVLSQNATYTVISLFDNAKIEKWPEANVESRANSAGLILELNTEEMTADVLGVYNHPNGGYSDKRGSMQVLDNGNAFVGYSDHSLHSEYSRDGTLLQVAQLKPDIGTYQSHKFDWVGNPKVPPSIYSKSSTDGQQDSTTIWVSWNGATEVESWNFYECDENGDDWDLLDTVDKTGFETNTTVPGYVQYVVCEALDADGESMGEWGPAATFTPGQDNAENDAFVGNDADSNASTPDRKVDDTGEGLFLCAIVGVLIWLCRRFQVLRFLSRRKKGSEYHSLAWSA